ncbi:hypothetical protein WG66_002602 [Moniliophthora roreri]|uniref:Uncharacterized protein n=1 Tax=Moniliophthora roreri TaxID=221103 RepID=A0A0W0F564_MONRR|nr:hypothetical protein WG66_002602 [Moniliophthora roreri]
METLTKSTIPQIPDTVTTEKGTPHYAVPGVPVPFVFGFVLDDAQLSLLAKARLSEELFNEVPSMGGYSVIVRQYFDAAKKEQMLLRYKDKHGQQRYLWVFGAVASITGGRPSIKWDRKKAKETLKEEKAETFVSEDIFCARWPSYLCAPNWLKEDFKRSLLYSIYAATRGVRARHVVPVPFVFGFVLDEDQLLLLAKARLSQEL